ncbi:MAG: phage portal protein [Bacteroidales bacterium]|nr:phage portal protein [Bacteroidales bacterium]
MDVNEIIAEGRMPADAIADLKKKSIVLPDWEKLEKEYNPRKHPVHTDPQYADKIKKGKTEKMTRITLGWQKLATKRMAELLFGIDVLRVYNDHGQEDEKEVAKIMEAIYMKNRINSRNIERGRWLYASCEAMTLWYAQEQPAVYAGHRSEIKLRCKSFSPFSDMGRHGERIYPLFDEFDDLVALSIEYTRKEDSLNISYFETYTADTHIRWRTSGANAEEELRETYDIGKIPAIYVHRGEPIWEDQSQNVYELEWSLSRNGNYVRKNSRPTWVVATDQDIELGSEAPGDNEGRNVLHYPAEAKYGYATWPQAIDSLKYQAQEIKNNFFMQLQLPDMSMDNMKSTPMSGEARKMVFIDSQMKVKDESGLWLEAFDREANVIKAFMAMMYPEMADAIDRLEVEHRITPYQIRDEGEKFQNLSMATNGKPFMSQRTAIKEAGYADDPDEEMEQIAAEGMADVMEPTI